MPFLFLFLFKYDNFKFKFFEWSISPASMTEEEKARETFLKSKRDLYYQISN